MKDKDYRELQISSSVLIFIFLGIIIVGIVIFLLGVSVGKRQVELAGTSMTPQEQFEEVVAEKPQPVAKEKDAIGQELEGHETAQRQEESTPETVTRPQVKTTQPAAKKPEPAPSKPQTSTPAAGQYYLQVGAFRSRDSAESVVEKYASMGYPGQVIIPSSGDSRQLFRVVIGGYRSRAEAQQAKDRLVQTEGQKANDYFIIQR